MAYYGYLLAGALVVPGWIAARVGERKRLEQSLPA
jgi:hypothetical protein